MPESSDRGNVTLGVFAQSELAAAAALCGYHYDLLALGMKNNGSGEEVVAFKSLIVFPDNVTKLIL